MNKDDLLTLLGTCAEGSALFVIAQEVSKQLNVSNRVRVVISELQKPETILSIYKRRLEAKSAKGERVPGLEETVQMLTNTKSPLRVGYAETDNGLVYFFADEAGNLVGCVS